MEAYTERANKSVPDLIKTNSNYVECWRNGYIRGASEQKQIDDEENGNALLYAVYKTEERTKREMIDKACEWIKRELADPMPDELYQQWCDDKLTDFRKAMEE